MTGMTMIFLAQPFLSSVASASAQQPQPKSFEDWCRQREYVLAATIRTIDVLLEKAVTQDCKLADRKLKTLTILDLVSYDISDLKPLAKFTNLTKLDLGGNQISDLKPLVGLTKLTRLDLSSNRISDVKPLAGLTQLTELGLSGNQIGNLKSLAGLSKLTRVLLDENPLAVKVCPVKPASICRF